jgi:ribonuclease Z
MRRALSLLLIAMAASSVAAQPPTGGTFRVTLMGTGAPPPDRARMGPSTLVEAGSQRLLFDVGRGVSTNIVAYGLNLGAIHTVFLTHLHVDHLSGFPDFWLTGHHPGAFGRRKASVTVIGPTGVTTMVRGLEQAYHDIAIGWGVPEAATHLISREFDKPGVVFDEGGVRVTAFRVEHGAVLAYGYRVDYAGHAVVISGDTGPSENVIAFAKGADLLVHEVFHISANSGMAPDFVEHLKVVHTVPEAAARVFSATKPAMAVATHLGEAPALTPELEARVRRGYAGRFVVGEDLMTFIIGDSVQVVRHR